MRKAVIVLGIFLTVSACSTKNNAGSETRTNDNEPNKVSSIEHHTPNTKEKSYEVENAKQIVALAKTVDGVKNAHVIVSGIYTAVGIEPTRALTKNEDERLRQNVYDAIRTDSHGRNAAITTNPEYVKKINELGIMAMKGHNQQLKHTIFDELGTLIGKIPPLPNQAKTTKPKDIHLNRKQERQGRNLYD
ncbi:YhcN/YlaJ family sporulation lipoprotein [Fictibacillus gelatini]|uniref:YhcN/YlaJ family sporulation lipoprotein n=1 Tax=Fictibacillus gelatini TaxID=225985 RepID=UPI00040B8FB3|nr:YhcN/YlaJ family sporulation lipoprotein [Fictibacillus gelatini]